MRCKSDLSLSRRFALGGGMALAAAGLAGRRAQAQAAAADALAAVKARGVIVCATEMQFPPFDFLVDNTYTGVDRDLMDAIAADMGVKAKYLDLPWTSVLPGLEAGKFDLCIAPVTITKARLARYSFTVPIAEATVALMARADDASVAKPQDIAGKTVGGQKGTAQVAQLKAFAATLPKPVTVKEYIDNNQSYADLAAGRLDASVNSLPNLGYVVKQRSDQFKLVLPPFGQPSYFSWVGRLDEKALVDAVSAVLVRMQKDGRLGAIQKKWFGQALALPTSVPAPGV